MSGPALAAHGPEAAAPARPPARRMPSRGWWADVWRRYRRNPIGVAALAAILTLASVAAFAPCICGTRPIVCRYEGSWYFPALYYWNMRWENAVFFEDGFRITGYPNGLAADPDSFALWPLHYADPEKRVEDGERPGMPGDPYGKAPSARNPLGTDKQGRDVLALMVHGTSTAILAGVVSMAIAGAIGIVAGALAGWFGGWVDFVLSRIIEVLLSIPSIILILAMFAVLGKATIWHVMVAIGLTRWEAIARYVRAEFIRLKGTEFVLAARALGVPAARMVFRHMLPHAMSPVIVALAFGIAGAILLESSLSFLGFVSTDASWGNLLNEGFDSGMAKWWLVLFPGFGIFIAVCAYNLAGDAFQEASDPRTERR